MRNILVLIKYSFLLPSYPLSPKRLGVFQPPEVKLVAMLCACDLPSRPATPL